MTIKYTHDKHGAFICGDTVSRITSYAYPTSTYATWAKRNPERVARDMIAAERPRSDSRFVQEYDAANWVRLGG